jgi:uroporphyrinogen decarboxylase
MALPMTGRDRIDHLLNHREPDRIGLWDAYWTDTLLRWQAEGLPASTAPQELLGFDFDLLYMDASLRLPERLLEETPEYTIRADKHGFVAKQWKARGGALGYLSHAVNDRADWERLRDRLAVDCGETARIGPVSYFEPFTTYPAWEALATLFADLRARGNFILLHVYGPFEAAWRRHGFEQSLMNLALEPALMVDMFEAHTDLVIGTLDRAQSLGIVPDGLFLVEDLGINTGPMFSPRQYRQLLYPCHRRLGEHLHGMGIAYFIHSDGDIRVLIPDFINAGIQVLQPLEARLGLDVRVLKREYGSDLCFMGNIDATRMDGHPTEIEAELREKITIARQGGGYIYHSDHSVPPTVSWERYHWVIDRVRRYGTYTAT